MYNNKLIIIASVLLAVGTAVPLCAEASGKEERAEIKDVAKDTSITAAIKAKYLLEDSIKVLDVHIQTVNGKVTLTGEAPDRETIKLAESIAAGTDGVVAVVSNLKLNKDTKKEHSTLGNLIPDATITAAVKSAFIADSRIKAFNIHVETTNGKVTLTGTVPDAETIAHVKEVASQIDGVKEVNSKLRRSK